MYKELFVLIPTYNPSSKLHVVLRRLEGIGLKNIVIIDDGSTDKTYLKGLSSKYTVLIHSYNKGKGSALKTGFSYLKSKKCSGVITVDDDLQQDILDIENIASSFIKNHRTIIGVRRFDSNMPFYRKIANKFIAFLFNKKYHNSISDVQTGLRCFPSSIFSQLCSVKGEKFDYELNVLIFLCCEKIPFKVIPIKTIYASEISRYKCFKDSYLIMKTFMRGDYK